MRGYMQRGSKIRRNGDLRGLPEVRVIGSSGEALGVMALAEALRLGRGETCLRSLHVSRVCRAFGSHNRR
jgi:translation initiation factor IF-3